ncbi:MAG: DNA replication/repair protein RecF [Alphaproteobacteria bacterium]|nr:DNA replication/repair protein RecF [Alphaproteobacteria bacterium]
MGLKSGIEQLRLTNFRSYSFMNMDLSSSFEPVVLTGHNGAGKTNILEAISFLVPGKGLRSARLGDVAKREAEDFLDRLDVAQLPNRWSISAKISMAGVSAKIGTGTIDGSDRRQVRIDGKNTSKQSDLAKVFKCLWLTPAQDRLFCGDPQARRRFLDRLVQAFDETHAVRLSEYNSVFKQWSCLLREGRFDKGWLSGLEEQLVSYGVAIAASRLDVIDRMSQNLKHPVAEIFPTAEIILTGFVEQLLLEKSAVQAEEIFLDKLQKSRKIYADGGSISGPHTADFKVIHSQKRMDASLCSTGEQKALLLSIILAEMNTQMQEQGICPLLLLDEAIAHLDIKRRHILFDVLTSLPAQVWMTGIDSENFDYLNGRAQFYDVRESNLSLKNVA